MSQPTKIWEIKSGRPHFLGQHIAVITPGTNSKAETLYANALMKAIKGEALPVSLSKAELKTALAFTLLNKGIPQHLLQGAIDRLNIDELPEAEKKPRKPRERNIRPVLNTAAGIETTSTSAQEATIRLGEWAYNPDKNAVFYGRTRLKMLPYISKVVGQLIEQYPQPITSTDIEQIYSETRKRNDTRDMDIMELEKWLIKTAKELKTGLGYAVPFLNMYPEMTGNIHLVPRLGDLDKETKAQLELVEFRNLTISSERNLAWLDGEPAKIFNWPHHLRLAEIFIARKGELIPPEILKRESRIDSFASVNSVKNTFTKLFGNTDGFGIHHEAPYGYVFHETREELLNALKQADPSYAKAIGKITGGARGLPGGATFEPQFL